jgi:hypothetical protein
MNIAFGALVLLILLLPGLVFRVAYLNVRYSGKSFRSTIVDETLLAVAPALILQLLGFEIVENIFRRSVSLSTIYQLIISSGNFNRFDIVEKSIGSFLLYNILIGTAAYLLGVGARKLIQRYKIQYKYPLFRFQNDWYHILKGTILSFQGNDQDVSEIDYVWVDVMLESKEGTFIYSGILKDFFLSKDEGLDRIYLTNVRRRKMSDDAVTDNINETEDESDTLLELDKRYYYMPGDFFVIPYSQIRNLNVIYYKREMI